MSDDRESYYLASRGKAIGPFPLDHLVSMMKSGDVSRADLVWREGFVSWISLDSVVSAAGRRDAGRRQEQPAQKDAFKGPVLARNAIYAAGASSAAAVLFLLAFSLANDSSSLAPLILLAVAYLAWWAWLEFDGCRLIDGNLTFPTRFRAWPHILPIRRRRLPLQELTLGGAFSLGPHSHGIAIEASGREYVLMFDSAFMRDMFALALAARDKSPPRRGFR